MLRLLKPLVVIIGLMFFASVAKAQVDTIKCNGGIYVFHYYQDESASTTTWYGKDELQTEAIEKPSWDELHEALKNISLYLHASDDVQFDDLVYHTQQTRLRELADEMDRKDALIRQIRNILDRCESYLRHKL